MKRDEEGRRGTKREEEGAKKGRKRGTKEGKKKNGEKKARARKKIFPYLVPGQQVGHVDFGILQDDV